MSPAIQYTHPKIYQLVNDYVSHNQERYPIIADFVGKHKRVFELACGTCTLLKYLDSSCTYQGWDLNKSFVKYGKRKGYDVHEKSIFDFHAYPESDVIMVIDVLHHIVPYHTELMKNIKRTGATIILVEPFTPPPIVRLDFKELKRMTGFRKYLYYFLNRFLGDNDGINPDNAVFNWNHNEESLRVLFEDYGAKQIIKSGVSLISII